jgi:hypothetical protein
MAGGAELAIIVRATDQASPVIAGVGQKLGGLGGVVNAPMGALKGFGSAVGGVVSGLGALGMAAQGLQTLGSMASGLVAGNAEMETFQTQLGTLMGSADAAKDRIAQLAKIGAETPFELPQLVAAEKIMLGFGLSGEKATKMTGLSMDQLRTSIGDMAAGTGVDLAELTGTWGKFSAGASGEAISRLQELGIVTREQLTEVGIKFSKSGELVSPLPEAMSAAIKIANEKFGGGMAQLSSTFAGQMSTLSDNFNQAKNVLMQPIFDVLKESLTGLNGVLSGGDFQAWLQSAAQAMAGAVQEAINFGSIFVDAIQGVVIIAQQALGGDVPSALANLESLLGAFSGRLIETLAGWGQAFLAWIGPMVPSLSTEMAPIAQSILQFVLDSAIGIVENLATWAAAFVDWIAPQIPGMLREMGGYMTSMVGWMLGTALPEILLKLAEWGLAIVEWVAPRIPPLLAALGGLLLEVAGWMVGTALPAIILKLAEWGAAFVGFVVKDVLPKLPGELAKIIVAISSWAAGALNSAAEAVASVGAGIITGIQNGVSSAVGGFFSWLQSSFIDRIPSFIKSLLDINSPSGVFFDIGTNLVEGLRLGMQSRLPSVDELIKQTIGKLGGSGDVGDWLAAAMHITGAPSHWMRGLAQLVGLESGGNPRAVNPTEVGSENATGLLQTLPSTFRAHAMPGMGDIFNPIHNAAAAIRYIMDTYGSVYSIRGIGDDSRDFIGYGAGGVLPEDIIGRGRSGQGYLLHAGETVVPSGRGGGGVTVVVNVAGHVTTERDLANMVRDQLVRTGRRNGNIFGSVA